MAQYAAMKYPDFLKQLASSEKKPYVELLQKSFIDFDDLLTQKEVVEELKSIAGTEVEEGEEPGELLPYSNQVLVLLRANTKFT